jgi:hypothetical protein
MLPYVAVNLSITLKFRRTTQNAEYAPPVLLRAKIRAAVLLQYTINVHWDTEPRYAMSAQSTSQSPDAGVYPSCRSCEIIRGCVDGISVRRWQPSEMCLHS